MSACDLHAGSGRQAGRVACSATVKEAHANGSGNHLDVIQPHTARASSSPSSVDEIRRKVDAARAAQEQWQQRPLGERIALLKRAAKEMLRRRAEVVSLAREEIGKVDAEALFMEALGPLDSVSGWASVVRNATGRRHVRVNPMSFPGKRADVDYLPRGVIGVIAPWNYPVAGLYRSTIPALMTGNGLILKPSEYTPRTSAWLAERLGAELPAGLVGVVQGAGSVGSALIDAGIDACVFTGSPRTGAKVRVQCAERGIPCSAEMGGKDPAIVLSDCDLPRTVAGITLWALSNAGQACGAIEVAYVDEQIADAFVARLRAAWMKLEVGGGLASVAALGNRRQLEIVAAQVEDARAKGATVVCGGEPGSPSLSKDSLAYPPTVLDRCDERMSVVTDETFGPVLAIVRVSGAADAIRQANAGRYGLGASIWTRDIDRARRLAERLNVGVVTVNNHAFSGAIPSLPWSGTRDTGFGVAGGPESLATFVRPKTTLVDQSTGPELFWMPYDRTFVELADILADAQLGRLGRVWKLPLAIRSRIKTIRDFFDWK
jgi:acyl-CoA reductase-like NAD-dependent aldehyde dehydrogenase